MAMFRARDHLVEHDLVTIPDGERLEVIATPEYLRNVMPFAAYFDPPRFDRDPTGVYIVTPSVDGDPAAMREHNRASISNTSIHEAFPGHHLQLTAAITHPSLIRAIADAPEFTEGWGMYSEQVMREEGFDDAPPFRLMLHTDAIWRACRIILDVRLHRGEISVADAIDFLDPPHRLRAPQRGGGGRALHLDADLPAQLPAGQGHDPATARRRAASPGRGLLAQALPRRAHLRRQPAGQLPPPAAGRRGPWPGRAAAAAGSLRPCPAGMQVIPSIDLKAGRSRLVFWPGAATGTGTPTDRPERIARHFVELGAPAIHLVDLDGAAAGRPVNTAAVQAIARAVATPLQLAGGVDGPEQIELAFAAGATRVVLPLLAVAEDPDRLAACLRIAGDWLAVGLDARPERFAEVAWKRGRPPTLESLVGELAAAGVRRFVLTHGGAEPDLDRWRGLIARSGAEFVLAGGVTDVARLAGIRDAGVRAILLGEALLGRSHRLPGRRSQAAA